MRNFISKLFRNVPNKRSESDIEFQLFILRALKDMTVRDIAMIVQTSLPTVQRWASGATSPVQSFRKHIMKAIEPEMLRREDEIYNRFFGDRPK